MHGQPHTKCMDFSLQAYDRAQYVGSFEHDIEMSASMKGGEFVDRTNGWHTLKIICLRELKICLIEWRNCRMFHMFVCFVE